jgi:hypothetical protein
MTTTDTRAAMIGLVTTALAALAAIVTGDLAVTLLSLAVGTFRLMLAHTRRPRSPHLYRARFVVQTWL